jgi:GT2 family glycosyltransferase
MSDPLSTFTIVVPTYERPRQLACCLAALAGQDYPRDRFEVIVVDDQSRRAPEAVVGGFRDRLDVALVVQRQAGPATARNTGAGLARGDYLAFTDDDCAPEGDWLRRLGERFAAVPHQAVGGRTINRLPHNPYSAASQVLVDYLYGYFQSRRGRFFTSNNLAVPRSAFRSIGGFDAGNPLAAGEDREFCVRWTNHGFPLLYAPEAIVHHAHALDFRRFCRQHFTYGRGAYYFRETISRGGHGQVELEPLAFYSALLRYPLARGHDVRAVSLSLLLFVSQLANALGFLYEGSRSSAGRRGAPTKGERA